jgi:N-acetylmuramoyl-L-alanine amidase
MCSQGGEDVARVRANANDARLLAQLMRAEAEGEGPLGMLMVGTVGVNRVAGNCSDFKGIRSIRQMVFQRPGGFEATQKSYFYQHPRNKEIRLAQRVIRGHRQSPAERALWFFRPYGACSSQWWGQPFTGNYKNHCFYQPRAGLCPHL